jgi:hypothetical protein
MRHRRPIKAFPPPHNQEIAKRAAASNSYLKSDGKNALTRRRCCTLIWGPFGFAQGRLSTS